MSLEYWSNIIQVISSVILAIFTVALWHATNTQKDIAKKQHDMEIYKLKVEHLNLIVKNWVQYNNYFVVQNNTVKLLVGDVHHSELYRKLCNIVENLEALKITSKYIFNEEIANIEDKLLHSIKEMNEVLLRSDYKNHLQNIYFKSLNKYTEIMELLSDNILQAQKEVNNAE